MTLYTVLAWRWEDGREMCTLLDEAFGDVTPALAFDNSRGDVLCLATWLRGGACVLHVYLACDGLPLRLGQRMGGEVSMG